jgi:hypothetical protein
MRFRNEFPAFDGKCHAEAKGSILTLRRASAGYSASLVADMKSHTCSVVYSGTDGINHNLEL